MIAQIIKYTSVSVEYNVCMNRLLTYFIWMQYEKSAKKGKLYSVYFYFIIDGRDC